MPSTMTAHPLAHALRPLNSVCLFPDFLVELYLCQSLCVTVVSDLTLSPVCGLIGSDRKPPGMSPNIYYEDNMFVHPMLPW